MFRSAKWPEMDKTQYDYGYVIISSIFIKKRNISFELP